MIESRAVDVVCIDLSMSFDKPRLEYCVQLGLSDNRKYVEALE